LALAGLVLCYRSSSRELPAPQSLLSPKEIGRAVQACRVAMKISNDESDAMSGAMNVSKLLLPDPPRLAQIKRFLAAPYSSDARRLLAALGRADYELTPRVQWLQTQFDKLSGTDISPPPLISGDDLKTAGLQPGPLFKTILDAVYDEQLEGHISSPQQALELALRLAKGN
jgi:hypothetical protein